MLSVSITPVWTWVWAAKCVRFLDLEFGFGRQETWLWSFLTALWIQLLSLCSKRGSKNGISVTQGIPVFSHSVFSVEIRIAQLMPKSALCQWPGRNSKANICLRGRDWVPGWNSVGLYRCWDLYHISLILGVFCYFSQPKHSSGNWFWLFFRVFCDGVGTAS